MPSESPLGSVRRSWWSPTSTSVHPWNHPGQHPLRLALGIPLGWHNPALERRNENTIEKKERLPRIQWNHIGPSSISNGSPTIQETTPTPSSLKKKNTTEEIVCREKKTTSSSPCWLERSSRREKFFRRTEKNAVDLFLFCLTSVSPSRRRYQSPRNFGFQLFFLGFSTTFLVLRWRGGGRRFRFKLPHIFLPFSLCGWFRFYLAMEQVRPSCTPIFILGNMPNKL